MTTETTTTTTAVTVEQIVQQLVDAHVLARTLGYDWKSIIAKSAEQYKASKPAAEPKAPKAKAAKAQATSAPRGELWSLVATALDGPTIEAQRSKPYSYAALIHTTDGWQVYAWVSSQETAKKRLGDARRANVQMDAHHVAEVKIAGQPAPSFDADRAIAIERAADEGEATILEVKLITTTPAEAEETAKAARRRRIATTMDEGQLPTLVAQPVEPQAQPEVVAEPVDDEPMHVMIAGKASRGTMVHFATPDGLDTLCGCGPERDYRQVEEAVTCRACLKVAQSRANA